MKNTQLRTHRTPAKSGRFKSCFRPFFPALVALLITVTASAAQVNAPALNGRAVPESNVFIQKKCSLCHSLDENGLGGGPALSRMVLSNNLMDFGADMWNHGPDMMRKADEMKITFPHLETQDVGGLISFMTAYRYYKKGSGYKGDPAKGEIVWKGMKCSGCHTLEGASGRLGSDLQSYKDLSPIQMAQAMWNHGPDMISAMNEHGINVPRFSGTDMVNLLAYIRARTGMKEGEVYAQLGDPERGAQVFREKQCITCHPVSGGNSGLGPQLERSPEFMAGTSGVAALMWNHSIGMWAEMKKSGLSTPKFKNQEMADLLAYLYLDTYTESAGDPALGKKLFELKKCMTCHKPGADVRLSPKRTYSDLDFVTGLWNHLPEMDRKTEGAGSNFPVIGPGEMNDLVAYLQQLQKTPGSR
jgi:cytochrome c2